MPRAAYNDVIEGPARRFVNAGGRLTIDPQLTQRLLADIERGGGSDALPLLAFTLEQLFIEYRRAGALRLQNYEEFGGLKGAIDAAVERAFSRADTDARIPRERKAREALLRRGLIPWLAGIDPDTRSSTSQHRSARGYSRGSARADRSARRGKATHHRYADHEEPANRRGEPDGHRRAGARGASAAMGFA